MSHMVIRARRIPRNEILDSFKKVETLTRSGVATVIGISYDSARYWLERLASAGLIRKEVVMISPKMRRVFYHRLVVGVYYRTQAAIMFYSVAPRAQTPDPIAEFRVTAVSERPGRFDLDEFMRAVVYVGVILAPQTFWIKQEQMVTGAEIDEPIDMDELRYSVPAYKRLDYAERYAVFFRSRRGTGMWRARPPQTKLSWWADPTAPVPFPREGDYEYAEEYIKGLEEKKVFLGTLKMRFDNSKGVMESVV